MGFADFADVCEMGDEFGRAIERFRPAAEIEAGKRPAGTGRSVHGLEAIPRRQSEGAG